MSETTTKLRAFQACSVGACGVRDLAADAIEAVEAQVAEAVARVEKLEKRPTIVSAGSQDDDRVEPAPVRRFKVGDRVRFVAEPRCTSRGYVGRIGTVKRVGDVPSGFDYNIIDIDGRGSIFANDSDLEPAPSAVPAPRGFREGDICRVIESKRTKENFLVGCEGRINPYRGSGGDWVIDCGTAKGVRCFYNSELTLVRAAAAPEAPAEDAGLVERLADVIWRLPGATGHWADLSEPERLRFQRDAVGVLATLRAESRLCAPGEVARLTGERDQALRAAGENTKELCRAWKERDALRADLAALKAKPRFRTRPVTAADVRALDDEWAKSKYVGRDSWSRAMNAVGLRRRVEQSK